MVFQQKNAHQTFATNRPFYTNWAPLTDDFYRHKTLDFSRRATDHLGSLKDSNLSYNKCISIGV